MLRILSLCLLAIGALASTAAGQTQGKKVLVPGVKIYIGAMNDDFDTILKKAIQDKKLPVSIVPSKDLADVEITGTSESQKAGAAKKLIMGSFHSAEQASISVADLKSGEVVFAYSVNKKDSAHGKRSTAEACAVHMKDEIEKNAKAK
jgi:hypothetical protein